VLANFTAAPQPLHLGPVHERGLELAPEAAEADGRPLAVDGDYLVLAPYQHIWVLD
jgi:amylosucrase